MLKQPPHHWPSHSSSVTIAAKHRPWKQCSFCCTPETFKNPTDFSKHLRECHCIKEGGSFVCTYGYNDVCSSLPVEGVSDQDYEDHVARHHIFQAGSHGVGKTASKTGLFTTPYYLRELTHVATEQQEWTIYSSTQNLPAVLNDPRRGKEKDFFTKTWGDAFVERATIPACMHLPEITRGHFEAYLKKTKKCKKSYRKSRGSHSSVSGDGIHKLQNIHSHDWQQDDLENIPKIFLQPNFSLASPETFNAVLPFIHQGQAAGSLLLSPASTSSMHLIQEKLSHYLDTVEVQIARHISLRSNAFFHAMTSHDALMEQLTSTIQQVTKLRDRVHHIDDILVKGSLRILKLKCRREKYAAAEKKLKLMATVHQTQPTIQSLLTTSDFVGALDLIATTQEVLDQELGDISSFRHLGSQLADMTKKIKKKIEKDFQQYAYADLNRSHTDLDLVMEEEWLVAIVMGMLRLKKHAFVNLYREQVFNAIKTLVKQTVINVVSNRSIENGDSAAMSLADQIRLLDFDDWIALVAAVLQMLIMLLTRIKAVHGVMSDTVGIAAGKAHCPASPSFEGALTHELTNLQVTVNTEEVIVSEEDHKKLSNDLTDMLTNACDYADDRSAKLFQLKSKDGFFEKLTINQFVIMSGSVDEFVTHCEAICGKRSTNLQLALQCQAHRFVSQFHDEKKIKLSHILDNERWKQSNVPIQFQNLVDHISSSESLSIPKHFCNNLQEENSHEYLLVKGEKYAVISTILLLLNMVVEYCDCVNGIPYMASDLLMRLVELLQIFTSRTCQLIIGAGALQLVGLKTITTKHLALASRCLQVIAFFIPKLKTHFDRYLQARQQNAIKQFDKVLKDYNDHIQEISNKLVSIMENMIEAQLTKWEVKPPVPSPCFREICKQFKKFHEAIGDMLPTEQIQKLFFRINTAFKGCLKSRLLKLNVCNDGGPQHGLVTSELAFYVKSLESIIFIRNVEDLAMSDIWVAR